MSETLRRVVEGEGFQRAVIALIMINGVAMGLETWAALRVPWGWAFDGANLAVQALFCVELAMRIGAHGRRPLEFFKDGWNVFDFLVVALSLLPAAGPLATVARLARVLRVGRLISGLPELRLIIGTMLRSIPSLGHVGMLLGLLLYIYGVIGHHLFAEVDPEHWGDLGRAVHTLFVVITLEGWVEIMRKGLEATEWAWLYYLTFIVVAVFVVINLFIAVVINNLEKVRGEEAAEGEAPTPDDTRAELRRLSSRIEEVHEMLRASRSRGEV